jgi:hypothetical protein
MNNLSKLLLAHRCEVPMTQLERNETVALFNVPMSMVKTVKDHPMWHKLYYGEQLKKAREHLAKLAKDFPAQAAIFAPEVEKMLADLAAAEVARAQKKAEMEQRRQDRAAKAAKKKELGVDLQAKGGVAASEATYRALRTGLKPIEDVIRAWRIETHIKNFNLWSKKLSDNGWDTVKAFPYRDRRGEVVVGSMQTPAPIFWKLFDRDESRGRWMERVQTVKARAEIEVIGVIGSESTREADEALAGYCAKLAGKVDSAMAEQFPGSPGGFVNGVKCTTANIWDNSILTVDTNIGRQVWHTKVIWNTSVLGKSFNQWPTRRIA